MFAVHLVIVQEAEDVRGGDILRAGFAAGPAHVAVIFGVFNDRPVKSVPLVLCKRSLHGGEVLLHLLEVQHFGDDGGDVPVFESPLQHGLLNGGCTGPVAVEVLLGASLLQRLHGDDADAVRRRIPNKLPQSRLSHVIVVNHGLFDLGYVEDVVSQGDHIVEPALKSRLDHFHLVFMAGKATVSVFAVIFQFCEGRLHPLVRQIFSFACSMDEADIQVVGLQAFQAAFDRLNDGGLVPVAAKVKFCTDVDPVPADFLH